MSKKLYSDEQVIKILTGAYVIRPKYQGGKLYWYCKYCGDEWCNSDPLDPDPIEGVEKELKLDKVWTEWTERSVLHHMIKEHPFECMILASG